MPTKQIDRRRAARKPAWLESDERIQADVTRGRGKCTTAAVACNFYFRDGSPMHLFTAGQDAIEAWRGRTEEDVLIERVLRREKPVASIVVQDQWMKRGIFIEQLINRVSMLGLSYIYGKNSYGMYILDITATPNASLWDLLQARDTHERATVYHHVRHFKRQLQTLRVQDYMVHGGFDASPLTPVQGKVNFLECALLYGYPLKLASSFPACEMNFAEHRLAKAEMNFAEHRPAIAGPLLLALMAIFAALWAVLLLPRK